ncbi:MAG: hypothetical protein ABI791_12615 [Acidobacteriota bacterium]
MRFDKKIDKKYRKSIDDAFEAIVSGGNDEHRRVGNLILDSKMLVRVLPVSKVNASGVTGLIDAADTNDKIEDERLSMREAFDEIYITIAEETIDTGGQRGCEGTFVHEGRHAFDFAQTIASFSDADVNPLSIFDPSLYELEWEAHRTSGEYMLCVARDEYIEEGIQLMILGNNAERGCFLNTDGINCRLRDSYGLTPDVNPGPRASELLGLRQR